MTHPHLSRAPIVEALVDLAVTPRTDLTHAMLTKLKDELAGEYPTVKEMRTFTAGFEFDQEKPPTQSVATEIIGYRLEKKDEPFVLMMRRDGLTVSRLAPYSCWDDLVAEAQLVWDMYVDACKPEAISRVATRFINRLDLPMHGLDFDDYLAAPPRIPKNLPETLKEFLVRLVIPDESGAEIALLQTLQGANPLTQTVQVLVDIDVYKIVEFEPTSPSPWELLAIMRRLKNTTFFGSITPKTLEMIT